MQHAGKQKIAPLWHIVDAKGQVLGRLASRIATIINGKQNVFYAPHKDCGDHVVVINARHIVMTGDKMEDKLYRHHSGYPGGLKEEKAKKLLDRRPTELLRLAVKGMMGNTTLREHKITKLHVFPDETHDHVAQQPRAIDVFKNLSSSSSSSSSALATSSAPEKLRGYAEVDPASVDFSKMKQIWPPADK